MSGSAEVWNMSDIDHGPDLHAKPGRKPPSRPAPEGPADRGSHGHAHHHDHHDHHHHLGQTFGPAFIIGIGLNLTFVVVEVLFGIRGNSVALLADAGHNLSDVLALVVAFAASLLSARGPSVRFTYGLRNSTILAALFNAMVLMVVVGAIAWEAIQRLYNPEPVSGTTVMIVAAIGILVNGLCALLFARGRAGDVNIRGAFLHMAADAGVSAGVVLAGLVIVQTGLAWVDPLVSLIVNGLIIWATWGLLRESLAMSMGAVPRTIDPAEVRRYLGALAGVSDLHDLHVWPLGTSDVALTCHLVMPAGHPGDAFLIETAGHLRERFGIGHPTLQIEVDPTTVCHLAPETVI
jgi:cobalt-zinc-cadmium efflux system protein